MIPTMSIRSLRLLAAVLWVVLAPAHAHDMEARSAAEELQAQQSAVISGVVEELVVEDRVKGTTLRYHRLRLEDGSAVALTGEPVAALATGNRVALTGRWNGSAFETAHADILAPPQPAVEGSVQLEGTLVVIHSDDFANGKSEFIYQVRDDSGAVTSLELAPFTPVLRGGTRVIVSGQSTSSASLRVQSIIIVSAALAPSAVEEAPTINSVLVIMANFNNTVAPAFTQAQAQAVMTTNAGSVANYYNEVSYGQQQLNVTVTPGWLSMNLAKPSTCDFSSIGTAADAAATAAGFNPSNYGFVVYLFTGSSQGGPGCGWSGLAYVGFPHQSWIDGSNSFVTEVVGHEMGHNFGLLHAGSLNCGGTTICSTGGAVAEYGDPWDIMGNARAMHFNAAQKSILGWIPNSSVKVHGAGTATYTFTPTETGGGATYAVEIPTANPSRTYWAEYRQPIGFDAPLATHPNNGAQIRLSSPFEEATGADDTEILDMTPGSSGGFLDSVLVVGQAFLDNTYDVNIMVTSATASALTHKAKRPGE